MPKTPIRQTSQVEENQLWQNLFAVLTGLFCATVLLKLGNPVIFEKLFTAPTNFLEVIFHAWPFKWGYIFLALLAVVGLKAGKLQFAKHWQTAFGLLLPLIWLTWQFVSATQTVDAELTRFTLKHFTACVVCFYLGWFSLGQVKNFRPIFLGVLIGFSCVILSGLQQHFGGLEETRRFFYELPNWRDAPSEFLQRVASNRIYATLFYPNTLAAVILLMLPISVGGLWMISSQRFSFAARCFLMGLVSIGALGCLYWSGSKSGWLLALLLGFLALLQLPFSPALKKWLAIGLVVIGVTGFAIRYAKFFERGATSVVARFDYWRAAADIAKENPIFGTGPGTFSISYAKVKAPESEMARLAHNDYLEQLSDSGIIGFLSFTAFIFGSLAVFCRPNLSGNLIHFFIWLGLVGAFLHSLVEFNLYIPAVAWPSFLFLGWLWSQRNQIDKNRTAS